ncbi:hypothetical protein [Micromonospora carbonacea]|uniref:Uncharacterized protein n=1 Tax=Micromonospora carbonacea TaxID=47853 RepID=A0A1C5AAU4_9ACTN|nr:hypothetical protein [Micromonospora carbonacea]SCF42144.1 hypothetical protein GA0070563_11243 [Micromonospora carbonacea]
MTAPTLTRTTFFMPDEPAWCVGCRTPDPGVIDHYSRTWEGTDLCEGASWRIQVTQRVQQDSAGAVIEGLAVIDVTGAEGTYGSTVEFARALLAAEALKNTINADRRRDV